MYKSSRFVLFLFAVVGLCMGLTHATQASDYSKSSKDDDVSQPPSIAVIGGVDLARNSFEVNGGAVKALNGDLTINGLLLRIYGAYDRYKYHRSVEFLDGLIVNEAVNGNAYQADVMLGYQWVQETFSIAAYVGLDSQDYVLSPLDLENPARGQRFGAKVVGEFETERDALPYYIDVEGSYSSAFNQYWARGRLGARLSDVFTEPVFVGPEGAVLGELGSDAQRVGGFASFAVEGWTATPIELTLAAGYQFVRKGEVGGTAPNPAGAEGVYGSIEFKVLF